MTNELEKHNNKQRSVKTHLKILNLTNISASAIDSIVASSIIHNIT